MLINPGIWPRVSLLNRSSSEQFNLNIQSFLLTASAALVIGPAPDTHQLTRKEQLLDTVRGLGLSTDNLAVPQQVHSSEITWIDSPGNYPGTDGLITREDQLILVLHTADCIPLFIVDPVLHTRGLVHAGWRGLESGIIRGTVEMFREKGSLTKDLHAVVGPAICQMHYQVGEEVAGLFPREFIKVSAENFYLDICGAAMSQMELGGLNKKNIHSTGPCTFEDPRCCSYRRDGNRAGRLISIFGGSA